MLSRTITYVCALLSISYISAITASTTTKNCSSKQSLTMIVKKTLKQNPAILKNSSKRQAAHSAIKQAKGGFLPKVDSTLKVGRSNTIITYPTNTTRNALNPNTADIIITQPIFSGLSTYNLVQQRKEEFKAASFTEKFTKEDLALQAVYAYINFLRFEHIRILAIRNINIHKEILAKVNLKYKSSAGTKADVDLTVGRLSEAKARLRNIEGAKENSVANFLKIVGITPHDLFTPTKIPNIPNNLNSTLDMALANNPIHFAALANFKAASKAVSVEKSNLMPKINIEVNQSYSNDFSGSQYNTRDTRGMLVARYNLFNGTSDLNNIDRASYYRQASLYNLHDTRNNIIEKTTKAWNKLKTDESSLIEYHKHLSASKKALYGYKKLFELGRASLLNVLDMENEVFDSEINVITNEYSIIIDRYELLANMGMLARYFENTDKK